MVYSYFSTYKVKLVVKHISVFLKPWCYFVKICNYLWSISGLFIPLHMKANLWLIPRSQCLVCPVHLGAVGPQSLCGTVLNITMKYKLPSYFGGYYFNTLFCKNALFTRLGYGDTLVPDYYVNKAFKIKTSING